MFNSFFFLTGGPPSSAALSAWGAKAVDGLAVLLLREERTVVSIVSDGFTGALFLLSPKVRVVWPGSLLVPFVADGGGRHASDDLISLKPAASSDSLALVSSANIAPTPPLTLDPPAIEVCALGADPAPVAGGTLVSAPVACGEAPTVVLELEPELVVVGRADEDADVTEAPSVLAVPTELGAP